MANYFIRQKSGSGTSGIINLKLAEALPRTNQFGQLETAWQFVINYQISALKLNDLKFYFAEPAAHACGTMGKKEAAKQFASEAIALSKIAKTLFARHKTGTAGSLLELQFRTLHEISNA